MNESTNLDDRVRRTLAGAADDARFDATRWGLVTAGREGSRRLPRGLAAIAAALFLGTALVGSLVTLSVLGGPAPRSEPRGEIPVLGPSDPSAWETCRAETIDYQLIEPQVGRPGTQIEIRGAIDTGGDERPASHEERIQVWWNLDPNAWETALTANPTPAVAGVRVHELKKQFLMYTGPDQAGTYCPYQVVVRTPEVPAGTYPIVVLYGGIYRGPANWLSLPAVEFTVVAAPSEPPLTGAAYADSLGLIPITDNFVEECDGFVQVAPSTGYCLDGHYSGVAEFKRMADRLQAKTPRADDEQ